MRRIAIALFATPLLLLAAGPARAEVTSERVNAAIQSGIAYLERQQQPAGNWTEYSNEPGGLTALCTLALLNSGRTTDDVSVSKALAYLERLPETDRNYSASLMVMAFTQANPRKYSLKIRTLAQSIAAHQMRDGRNKGGWTYSRATSSSSADNSNTQFAILALHEAERAGVEIADQTWQLALNYWTQPGMQQPDGAFGYEPDRPASGSMTCAAIASLIIARDRLHGGDATVTDGRLQCCGNQTPDDSLERALAWMGQKFSVERNPGSPGWLLYYLYALECVGRMSGQRYFVSTRGAGNQAGADLHDWYREGCEHLVASQDKLLNCWIGIGPGEADPVVGTALALMFLSKGRRPVVIAKLKHQTNEGGPGTLDWDHHRRAVQNLTLRIEPRWKRDLSWQTIDFSARAAQAAAGGGVNGGQLAASAADLLEAPVLFLSGSNALTFDAAQKKALKEYIENGGFLFAEACSGNGCNGEAFDRTFRALMREIFPDSELRKLPPDHAAWYAEQKVDPKHLPKDAEFWLWGLDACCRTSVIYCPRSLSCYWEVAHPYRDTKLPAGLKDEVEAVMRIGMNVVAYATGRELKDKLDRPQLAVSNPGGRSPRGALVVPKLSHAGGADEAPAALNNLLTIMERQLEMRVDYQRRLIAPTDAKLLDYPMAFMHGRRAFRFSAAERKALKDYLDRGGFLFADSICGNKEFAEALRVELKSIYPDAPLSRIPPTHAIFTDEFHGFQLASVMLRDPQIRAEGDPLTAKLVKTTPLLEALELDGRLAVIFSPYDLSCALEKGASLECKGYIPADAARIGANVLLYGLQQ